MRPFQEKIHRYRAWDDKNKKFAITGFHIIGECTVFDLVRQYSLEEACDLVITEFIGIKDVSGQDIYEGDIVTFCFFGNDVVSVGEVKYDKFGAGFYIEKPAWTFYSMLTLSLGKSIVSQELLEQGVKNLKLKVIGNIFENDYLLPSVVTNSVSSRSSDIPVS